MPSEKFHARRGGNWAGSVSAELCFGLAHRPAAHRPRLTVRRLPLSARFLATLTRMSTLPASTRESSLASRQFSIGLIGGGNISETHARAARAIAGVTVAAVYGSNAEKVSRLALENGGTPYERFDAFLRHRPMDLVMIGSPSGLHAEHGIAAAGQGLDVLTEKPIDISTERADALIAAAAQASVKLGVLFQDRTKPHLRQLKSWIEQGLLGRPLFVDACVKWYRPPEYYSNSRWRGTFALDGGGALINQGIHTVDLLLWLLGDVSRVQSRIATQLHKIEAEDTAVVLLEFANGALGTFHATTAAYPGYPRRVEITGSGGTVIVEHDRIIAADLRDPSAAAVASADLARLAGGAADRNQSATSAAVSDFRGHQLLVEDFLQAIEENRAPLCDGREGRRSLALVEQIYNSARAKP
jgi:UDP-N-acetyl-2-amino-2-deoxyglucuronate dehydrogenase